MTTIKLLTYNIKYASSTPGGWCLTTQPVTGQNAAAAFDQLPNIRPGNKVHLVACFASQQLFSVVTQTYVAARSADGTCAGMSLHTAQSPTGYSARSPAWMGRASPSISAA